MFGFKKFKTSAVDYIVVGLGNPGKKFEGSRHNAGFMVLDFFAKKLDVKFNKVKFKSDTATANLNGKKLLLMKPATFMNLSGQAVVEAMNFYKISPKNIIVIYDDVALCVGRLRIRQNGSDGGQKGMQNIIKQSGTSDFPRVRVGVGEKPHPDYDLSDWVLSKFSASEKKLVEKAVEKAVDAVEIMIDGEIEKAMNIYNRADN